MSDTAQGTVPRIQQSEHLSANACSSDLVVAFLKVKACGTELLLRAKLEKKTGDLVVSSLVLHRITALNLL